MDNLESIDKYLVSEIDGMETIPSDQLWNSIDAKLQAGKAARKVRSRRWKMAGVSALTIAAASVITYATLSEHRPATNNDTTSKVTAPVQNSTAPIENNYVAPTNTSSENKLAPAQQNTPVNKVVTTEKELLKPTDKTTSNTTDVALNGTKQEMPVKSTVVTTPGNDTKKDNSDKDIIMLPYFAPNYAGTNAAENDKASVPPPSVSTKIDQAGENTPKTEPKENTIYMPNAFTPNGDGLNDIFLPQTAETPGEYKLTVFDRSGNLVFFSDDIQKGWDGRINKNGLEEVKEDVYIWRMEMKTAKGEKRHLMGSVTLLK